MQFIAGLIIGVIVGVCIGAALVYNYFWDFIDEEHTEEPLMCDEN